MHYGRRQQEELETGSHVHPQARASAHVRFSSVVSSEHEHKSWQHVHLRWLFLHQLTELRLLILFNEPNLENPSQVCAWTIAS